MGNGPPLAGAYGRMVLMEDMGRQRETDIALATKESHALPGTPLAP
jgi:hypothetical protein